MQRTGNAVLAIGRHGGAPRRGGCRPPRASVVVRAIVGLAMLAACLAPTGASANAGAGASASATAAPPRATQVDFLLDHSGSMREGSRMANLKAAAKLGAILLDGRLRLVAFSNSAEPSPTFDLSHQRAEAVAWIETLEPTGGTAYVPAIGAIDPGATAVLLFSDGIPNEESELILGALASAGIACPMHTVAQGAPPEAEQLLARMAAATGGGFHRVEQPEGVVEAFLRVLGEMRGFRRHDLTDQSLRLDDLQGEVLVIGFDVAPQVVPGTGAERYQVVLAGSTIHVARERFARRQPVTIGAAGGGNVRGRMIVLRFDLPVSRTEIQRTAVDGRPAIRAASVFYDAQGRQIDPRGNPRLTSRFELFDAQGNLVHSAPGEPALDRPAMEACLPLPADRPDGVYEVRAETIDHSGGTPFSSVERRAVDLTATGGAPEIEPPHALRDDELQLLVVAHKTTTGRHVVFDSAQQGALRPAMAGDRLACELVRGAADPRVFAALAGGLRARFIGEDGAVRDVRLTLKGDRYVTEPIAMRHPGVLTVEVDVALGSLRIRIEGKVEVAALVPKLRVAETPLLGRLGCLPSGTLMPVELSLGGIMQGRPAAVEDLRELVRRDGLRIQRSLHDAAGKTVESVEHVPTERPWRETLWLQRTGQLELRFELLDAGGAVLDGARWRFEVVESPLVVVARAGNRAGEWVSLADGASSSGLAGRLPQWLVRSPECCLTVQASRSPFFAGYYLAGVRMDDREIPFDPQHAWFAQSVSRSGEVACVGQLRPYDFADTAGADWPEIQVLAKTGVVVPVEVRWGRAVVAAALLAVVFGAAVALAARQLRTRYLDELRKYGYRLALWGDNPSSLSLVDAASWWPRPEVVVCRSPGAGLRLAHRGRVPAGAEIVAAVRQRRHGIVTCTAVEDLPELGKGETTRVDEPGADQVRLTSESVLALEAAPGCEDF